ncbi:MAG: xanthine dehydrogenase family protein molybdopterin-binding subunit, partial [Planctomycetia bacterium]
MATVEETKVETANGSYTNGVNGTNGHGSPYKVIGTRPIRPDGADKVTGRALYANDVSMTGMVYGKILRSPHAHAKLKSIDASAALKLPGVLAVCTRDDFHPLPDRIAELGEGAANMAHLTQNCMAREKVFYKGHPTAAVAATSPHIAEEAMKLIKIDYEPLPAVTWVMDALKPDAPILHDDLKLKLDGTKGAAPSNIANHLKFELGDLDKGFAEADVVVEREFRTASVHQGYIEPHACVALWNNDGSLKIWASTQGAFTCRQQTAEILELPVSKVTVVPCEIGGGFGGKITVYLEPVAAMLSKKCGRPVKISMSRADVFESTGPSPGSFLRVKMGATKAGRLTAAYAFMAYDSGAFPANIYGMGCTCMFSAYDVPNARIDGVEVCNNKPRTAAYRAPGSTNAMFASEMVVDEIARKLGADPIDFRLKNAAREGTRRVDGPAYPRIGLVETLEAAKNHPHWSAPLEGKNRGRGVAVGFWMNAGLKSAVSAAVNADGTVNLVEGSTDIGGSRASMAMMMAETLGLRAEDVLPKIADTDGVGYTDITGGSRTTYATGMAVYEAGLAVRRTMAARAAQLWEVPPADVTVDDGVYRCGDRSLTFKELAGKLHVTGGPVVESASVDAHGAAGAFATHLCDLEVDPETGKTRILRYTAIQDCGRAIHPSYVE